MTDNMLKASDWINHFKLEKHPEGGYYKETYRSEGNISQISGDDVFPQNRSFSTGIYFLLESQNFSAFHRIRSDEMWHFYAGSSLVVYVLEEGKALREIRLGQNIAKGEVFQAVVPANAWFASELRDKSPGNFTLVGCTVAPGFDFRDFELAKGEVLINLFPENKALIERLTRL